MWPSQRLASINLESWQGKAQAQRRDRRGIRPIVTLLEERTLLSQPGTWATVAPLPTARVLLGTATGKDGTIYAIGGRGLAGVSSEVDAYNPTTNTWRTVAPLPTVHSGLAAETGADDTIYAIAGADWNNQPSSNVYAYNPATNIWTQVASMPTAHAGPAAVGKDGTIYEISGEGESTGPTSEVDAYNPTTNSWTQVASLPTTIYGITDFTGRNQLAAARGADGTIYAIGGQSSNGVTSEVDAYNPTTNTWTQVASLPTDRRELAATTRIDGTIYAIGGYNDEGGTMNEADAYNPSTNTWNEIASLPSDRIDGGYDLAATTVINGTIYAIGGWNETNHVGVPSPEVDAYIPTTINLTVTTLADDPSAPISGSTTLRDAITQANTSTDSQEVINFASGLQGTIDLTQALPALNNNITLNGPGASNLTVKRDSSATDFSVLTVDKGATVSVFGLTISGGDAGNDGGYPGGGGLDNSGTLTVSDSVFSNNTAGAGGAIFNGSGGTLVVTGSTFIDNGTSVTVYGSGIFNEIGATATVTGSTFTGNSGTGDGGGGIFNEVGGTLTVSGSIFTGNVLSGIVNGGVLTVSGSTFTANSGTGGILNEGTLTVTDSTFTSNFSYNNGGGISSYGTVTVTDSTFSGNSTSGFGGGIANVGGTLTVSGSTFTGNSANIDGLGGGIYNGGTLTVSDSTFTSNSANAYGGSGGGLWNYRTAILTNCTFTNNSAISNGYAGSSGSGGGIASVAGSLTLNNTIVAGNQASVNPDFYGAYTGSHNLIGGNPLLGSLANNGGPTQTMALLPGSPAIDAGSNALAVDPTTGQPLACDQRGPGFPRILGHSVDIGAYEFSLLSQTINFGPLAGQTYGVALIALDPTDTSGLPVSYRVVSGPATISDNLLTITGAGNVDVEASQPGNATYSAAAPVDESFTVSPATLTITSTAGQSMVYGGTMPALIYTYTGLVNGNTSATFSGGLATTATSSSSVGSYPITQGTLAATGNYTVGTYNLGMLTVNAAPLTITANNDSKTYGTLKTFSSTAFAESGLVKGDTITGVTETSTGAATSATVGTYNIVPSAATGNRLSNYTIGYVNATLTVNPASLLSLTVTTLADDPSAPISGSTTLRDAITQANASTASQEIINFASGLQGTIDLTQALPALNNNISIQGPGASNLTVQRDPSAAAFSIFTVNSGMTDTIAGITVAGGYVTFTSYSASFGGGIVNRGTLTVNNDIFTNNSAFRGGGIYNNGTLTVTNSAFANNSVVSGAGAGGGLGGGIYNDLGSTATVNNSAFTKNYAGILSDGTLVVSNSTFTYNVSGIQLSGSTSTVSNSTFNNNFSGIRSGGTLRVDNSTFNNNGFLDDVFHGTPVGTGGGICNDGTLSVTNSTFANNSAYNGGGIYNDGTLSVTNSTFANNSATMGGGISSNVIGTLTLNNMIVAGNTGDDIYGQVQPTSAYNLIGDGAGITNINQLAQSNLIGTTANPLNPKVGPLANNGGPTQTMAPLSGSPAINAGSNALAVDANGSPLTTDQRGAGFPRVLGHSVDIGAYEFTPLSQTISFGTLANHQTYGVAPIALTAPASSGLPVSFMIVSGPATLSGNVLTITGAGGVVVEADQAGNATYNAAPSVDESFTVSSALLTITANNATKAYGDSLPLLGVSYSGFVNGDTAAKLTTPPTLATTATASSHVFTGGYPITASGTSDPDYTISYQPGMLTITAVPLTITANNAAKMYGAVLQVLTPSYSGLVNGDTSASLASPPTVSKTASSASHVGSYAINASGASDPDYTITYVPGTLTVIPASLTITANGKTKVYGAGLPTMTASYSGWVNGDSPGSLTASPTLSTTATAAGHLGSYTITASGATSSDYAISYVGGTLTVTPAPLTITADSITKVYGSGIPALTASYSGWVNGDQPGSLMTQAALSTTAIASSHVGSYAINATGAASSDYTISYAGGTLSVIPALLTITVNDVIKVYGAVIPTLTAHYDGFVNGDTAASLTTPPVLTTTATASSNVLSGGYDIAVSGASDSDYTFSYVDGTLTVTPAPLTVTATDQSMTYGSTVPAMTYTSTGLVNNDTSATFSGSPVTTATSSSSVGDYPITVGTLAATGNYTVGTYNPSTLTIAKADTTITVTSYGVTYDGNVHNATGTSLNGLVINSCPYQCWHLHR